MLNLIGQHDAQSQQINRVAELHAQAEGKGINVSRVLAAHQCPTLVMGFAGGMSGTWFRQTLDAAGLRHHLTPTQAELRCGVMVGKEHHPTTILANGFVIQPTEVDALVDDLDQVLQSETVSLVMINGSVPHPQAHDLIQRLVACCRRHQQAVWVDSYGPAMDQALSVKDPALLPDLVKPNREELATSQHYRRCFSCHVSDGANGVKVYGSHQPRLALSSLALTNLTLINLTMQRHPIA